MTHNILIVDDTPDNLHLLAEMLGRQNYKVRPASNGLRALATVKKERPDLILLDIRMPDLDGYETCRRLKADESTRDIPVIFISALGEVFDKLTAFAVGGVDYVTKPFQVEEVIARVQTHLALQDMRLKLQEKNEQLLQQNAELDAFAHTVAHDLKNPLAKIMASITLLEEFSAPMLDEEMGGVLRVTVGAAHKMSSIIDELLLLARVRKNGVQTVPLEMTQVVYQVQNRLSHLIEEYQAEVIIPNTWPAAMGYAPWVEEVWANYLSNSLRYGGRPPQVELGATPQADGLVRFWIRDNGQGLTPEEQARLFTEFTKLNQVKEEGYGLGLSIVQRIVDKLGGQVGVTSQKGSGSEFYFTLPALEGGL